MTLVDSLLAWITPPIVVPTLIVIAVAVAWLAQ
jgi:hypothetical protein